MAKDKITGFTGVVVTAVVFNASVPRLGLQPRELGEGGYVRSKEYFDINQLELVTPKVIEASKLIKNPFKMLDTVKHTLTGFEGKVTSIVTWLNGCVRIGIQSTTFDKGKPVDDLAFPVQEIELLTTNTTKEKKRTGGDRLNPTEVKLAKGADF